MNDWKLIPTIALTTVLIFGAGVFTGGLLVNYTKPQHASTTKKTASPSVANPSLADTNTLATGSDGITNGTAKVTVTKPEILSKQFLQKLDDELHLSAAEHDAVQKVMNDGLGQMRKVIHDARLEIRDVLPPEKQRLFDDVIKRQFNKSLFNSTGTNVIATNTVAALSDCNFCLNFTIQDP
ncbi:MAG TPA: hypothetical protein VF607_07200 [Verrucomicrobiae bacterium]